MDRRAFLASLTLGLLAEALPAEAQPAKKVWRIGFLSSGSPAPSQPVVAAIREGLQDRGWVEGQNIIIEYRWAEGRAEKLHALAAELVALNVDLIVTTSTPAALAAKRATAQIPIVFGMVSDPVASGLVASLARPGGNATGWSNILPEMIGKLLGLIREAVPRASRIAVLGDPTNPGTVLQLKAIRDHARSLGVTIQSVEVPTPETLDAAFSAMGSARPDALITLTDAVTLSHRGRIVEFAAKHRVPAIYQVREVTDAGGLMSYGLNRRSMDRRSGSYMDKILRGAKPADLPVEQPTTFELVINLKTAKALGLTIAPSLLGRADQVIQ
jgi:putative ABC transport system substrate-binding protein